MIDEYRLPRSVVPHRYQIRLEPDLNGATFAGSETITVEVSEPVNHMVLNAAELDLKSVSLRAGGETIPAEVELDEKLQRATLRFPRTIEPGEADLDIEFSGILNDQLDGFYRSTFTDVDGVEQTIATTQFEATDARRAFPCWDEPDFKASFPVTTGRPRRPIRGIQHDGGIARMRWAKRSRCGSPTPWSCRPILWRSWSDHSRQPSRSTSTGRRSGSWPHGQAGPVPFALECASLRLSYLT